jgi:hypothetical protein
VGSSGTSSLDRQIAALSADAQVDAELDKIRTELAAPAASAGELSEGQPAEQPAAAQAEQPAAEPEREQ